MVQRRARNGSVVRRCFLPRARDRPARRAIVCLFCVSAAVLAAGKAYATDYEAGVGGTVIYTGNRLVPALTPHFSVSWRSEAGWFLAIQDTMKILPARSEDALGVYNHLAVGAGRAWENGSLRFGVALPAYSMLACRGKLCGRVVGTGFGGYAQGNYFFASLLGVSLGVNVDWLGGSSEILPGGLAAMVVAGPVVRW